MTSLFRKLARWTQRRSEPVRCAACPLATCSRGSRAAVIRMECPAEEARRLRTLGLFEGACVTVVDRQEGLLLEVRGAKLALGAQLAAAITVLPLGG